MPKLDFQYNMFVLREYDHKLESEALSKGFKYTDEYGVHTTLPQTAYPYRKYATDDCLRIFEWMQGQVAVSRQEDGILVTNSTACKWERMFPFQFVGIGYILHNPVTLLADEMGLGKTAQVLGAIGMMQPKHTLIVCPSGLKYHWRNEIMDWLNGFQVQVIEKGKDKILGLPITIISYDLVRKAEIYDQLRTLMPFDFVALDEAHYLKTRTSQRTKMTLGHRKKPGVIEGATRIVAISGTPLLNRPVELWPLILRIFAYRFPHCYLDYKAYTKFFCGGFQQQGIWNDRGATNLHELKNLLRQRIMIRRKKVDVLEQLPDKTYTLFDVQPDSAAKKALYEEKQYRAEAISGIEGGKLPPIDAMAEIRRILGTSKAKHVAAWVADALDDGIDKIVVFAHHRDAIAILEDKLKKYKPVVIHGGIAMKKREGYIKAFQEDKKVRVFIGSLTAASEGVTLTAASHVVFCEIDWVPGRNEQAVDRCHRIGQKKNVNAYFFIYEGSLDAYVLKRSLQKQKNIEKVLE